jgi:hypothetical protein
MTEQVSASTSCTLAPQKDADHGAQRRGRGNAVRTRTPQPDAVFSSGPASSMLRMP